MHLDERKGRAIKTEDGSVVGHAHPRPQTSHERTRWVIVLTKTGAKSWDTPSHGGFGARSAIKDFANEQGNAVMVTFNEREVAKVYPDSDRWAPVSGAVAEEAAGRGVPKSGDYRGYWYFVSLWNWQNPSQGYAATLFNRRGQTVNSINGASEEEVRKAAKHHWPGAVEKQLRGSGMHEHGVGESDRTVYISDSQNLATLIDNAYGHLSSREATGLLRAIDDAEREGEDPRRAAIEYLRQIGVTVHTREETREMREGSRADEPRKQKWQWQFIGYFAHDDRPHVFFVSPNRRETDAAASSISSFLSGADVQLWPEHEIGMFRAKWYDTYSETFKEADVKISRAKRYDEVDESHHVADFDNIEALIEHAKGEGATHADHSAGEFRVYFPVGHGWQEALAFQKEGYWHLPGPNNRAIVKGPSAKAEPIENWAFYQQPGRKREGEALRRSGAAKRGIVRASHLAEAPHHHHDAGPPYTIEEVNKLIGTRSHRKASPYDSLEAAKERAHSKAVSSQKFMHINVIDRSGNIVAAFDGNSGAEISSGNFHEMNEAPRRPRKPVARFSYRREDDMVTDPAMLPSALADRYEHDLKARGLQVEVVSSQTIMPRGWDYGNSTVLKVNGQEVSIRINVAKDRQGTQGEASGIASVGPGLGTVVATPRASAPEPLIWQLVDAVASHLGGK